MLVSFPPVLAKKDRPQVSKLAASFARHDLQRFLLEMVEALGLNGNLSTVFI